MPWSTQQPLLSKAKNREKQDKEGACSVERKHKKRHTVSEVIYEWQVEADEYKKKTGVGMFLNCKKKKSNRCNWHFAILKVSSSSRIPNFNIQVAAETIEILLTHKICTFSNCTQIDWKLSAFYIKPLVEGNSNIRVKKLRWRTRSLGCSKLEQDQREEESKVDQVRGISLTYD